MFEKVYNINMLNDSVNKNELVFVYFGQPNCSVCHGLKPQIENKFKSFMKDVLFFEVNTFDIPEVSGIYQVMTVPVIILFYNGKEYIRKARFVPIQQLYDEVEKVVDGVKSLNE